MTRQSPLDQCRADLSPDPRGADLSPWPPSLISHRRPRRLHRDLPMGPLRS